MDLVYIVGALVVAVLLLFYIVYSQSKRSDVLTGNIQKLYTEAADSLKKEIDIKNTAFKE